MNGKNQILKRMLLSTIPFTIIGIVVVMVVSLINMKEQLQNYVYTSIQQTSLQVTESIHEWTSEIQHTLKAIKGALESIPFDSDKEEIDYLATTLGLHDACPYGVYGGDASGVYLDGSGWVPDADYVPAERDWYKEGLNNTEFMFGTPYVDAQTGEMIVSSSVLLDRPDRNNMVIAADVFLGEITSMLGEMSVMDTKSGYVFMVDVTNGIVLAHKNADVNGYVITENDENIFYKQIYGLFDKEDNKIYTINDKKYDYLVTRKSVDGTNWVMFTVVEKEEAFKEFANTTVFMVVIAVVIMIIISLAVRRALVTVTKPIKSLTGDLSRISDGDFTVDVHVKDRKDEVTHMSKVMSNYVTVMRKVISDIQRVSLVLEENANSGKTTAGVLGETVEKQNTSMSNMQKAMNDLNLSMDKLSVEAGELQNIVNVTHSAGVEVNTCMEETRVITDEGHKEMINVQDRMKNISLNIKDIADVVKEVEVSTNDISEMMGVIQDMASQTNMLSLNASIEAARAGEAGRGFSIVAEEIGRLADVSKDAANNVNGLVEKIISQVNVMIDKTNVSMQNIKDNAGAIDKACDTFENIENNVKVTSDAVTTIVDRIKTVERVSGDMSDVTKIQSDNVQVIFENIDSLSEDAMLFTMESKDVKENAEKIADSAQVLVEHMKFFTIN